MTGVVAPGGAPEAGGTASEPDPDVVRCPNCGSASGPTSTCAQCGYLFEVPDALAVWEEQRWEVVVRADRTYFDAVDPDGMAFPDDAPTRRLALIGDTVRIGRRSTSKGTAPQVDLSGPLEDLGVSHRHGLLMRQPDGAWALVDEGSTNGTYLNSLDAPVPPNQRLPLRDGDRIHLGAWTTLTVERADAEIVRDPDEELPSKDTRDGVAGPTRRGRRPPRAAGPHRGRRTGDHRGTQGPGRAGRPGPAHRHQRLDG